MKKFLSFTLASALFAANLFGFADFYESEEIKLFDPLTKTLGVNDDGILSYHFSDVAKTAGHTCTATAGAWMMLKTGLKELYGDSLPERGNIKITIGGKQDDGVSGVIANVAELITGATKDQGFKGIFGQFNRMQLLDFGGEMFSMQLERLDTHQKVNVHYEPKKAMKNWANAARLKQLQKLMQSGAASDGERAEFAKLWQEKVKILLNSSDKVIFVGK